MLIWWLLRLLINRPAPPDPAAGCGRCGCPAATHEHYRPGRDCGRCGPGACPRFEGRARGGLRLLADLARLLAAR